MSMRRSVHGVLLLEAPYAPKHLAQAVGRIARTFEQETGKVALACETAELQRWLERATM